jgi:hypothetical protein
MGKYGHVRYLHNNIHVSLRPNVASYELIIVIHFDGDCTSAEHNLNLKKPEIVPIPTPNWYWLGTVVKFSNFPFILRVWYCTIFVRTNW